jgi:CheY-like chemotaxis protein
MGTTRRLDTGAKPELGAPEANGHAVGASAVREFNDELAGPETASVTPVRIIACECGQGDCDLTIEVTLATYQRVRIDARRFLVAKRHRFAGSWDVVASNHRFSIVERDDQRSTNGASPRLRRVLIVDDDESLRKLYAINLQLAGFAVLEAADGSQALERARLLKPALIITDVMMPRMDGFELAEALRRDERTRKIPLIFISVKTEEASVARAQAIGALAYLTKSRDPEATTTRIVDLLAQRRRADGFLAQVREARKKHAPSSRAMPAA